MPRIEIRIPPQHPVFAGHFPGMPVVPGAMLLDEALWAIEESTGVSVTQWIVKSVKFKMPVRPGELVTLRFEQTAQAGLRFELHSPTGIVGSGVLTRAAATGNARDEG